MEAQVSARRRRRQEAGPAPEFVPPTEREDAVAPDGPRDDEVAAAQMDSPGAPAERPAERSYQELFDAIPPDVLTAATEPLRPEELVCVCMDDRNPDDGIYSAGGMILLDLDNAVQHIRELGITALKSHPGCAAGALLARRRGLPAEQGDSVAIEQAMRIAERAGIRYAGASAVDPEAPHAARAALIFVDIPARRALLGGYLPPAFYISGAAYPNREALISDALLPARIILEAGDGFSQTFTREAPFSVVFIGKDRALVRDLAAVFQARMQAVLPVQTSECLRISTVI
jgi:hypothetical protein